MALNNGVKLLNILHVEITWLLDRMTTTYMFITPVIIQPQEYAKLTILSSPLSIGVMTQNILDLIAELTNSYSLHQMTGHKIKVKLLTYFDLHIHFRWSIKYKNSEMGIP